MQEIKNVIICGLGAIGCIYADIIKRFPDVNLKILVDKKRYERYKSNPLVFNEKIMNLDYILPDDKSFKADLIIVATKNNGLESAIKYIKNFINDKTIIMSLLNGVISEKIIASEYGIDKVLYSYFIGHSAMREGRFVFQDGVHKIVFGSPYSTNNIYIVKSFFDKVGINYEIPDDIIYSMWLKFMLNVSSNQISAVLRYTFGEMHNNEKCMFFIKSVMEEVKQIAKAEGVNNTETMVDDALKILKVMSPDGKTSMLQDVESGRDTEVDIFAGYIIECGKKYNILTPYNLVLKGLIDIIQENNYNNLIIYNSQ